MTTETISVIIPFNICPNKSDHYVLNRGNSANVLCVSQAASRNSSRDANNQSGGMIGSLAERRLNETHSPSSAAVSSNGLAA